MSSINVNVTEGAQIKAALTKSGPAVTVGGGVGPQGPQGAAGATGPQGPAGTTAWSEITGRPTTVSGSGLTDAVATSDSRLTDSREWTAATVPQVEAEAGTATTRRAFTAQRVFQAVAAWWAALAVPIAKITGLQAELDGKAATNAPTFANQVTFTTDNASTTTINGGSLGADSVWFADAGPFSRQRYPYTNTERDKLAGIATGATANATDAQLRDRATHTGTQAVGTITGLAAIATSGSASDLGAGTLPFARIPTGTTSTTVCIGNDSRLSDARAPSGAAGGDLTGTYPNPTIAAGAVTEADLANAVRVQMLHPFLLAGM